MGLHWGGIVPAIDVVAMIAALGTIGALPALLGAFIKYTRLARWLSGLQSHSAATSASNVLCNKA